MSRYNVSEKRKEKHKRGQKRSLRYKIRKNNLRELTVPFALCLNFGNLPRMRNDSSATTYQQVIILEIIVVIFAVNSDRSSFRRRLYKNFPVHSPYSLYQTILFLLFSQFPAKRGRVLIDENALGRSSSCN